MYLRALCFLVLLCSVLSQQTLANPAFDVPAKCPDTITFKSTDYASECRNFSSGKEIKKFAEVNAHFNGIMSDIYNDTKAHPEFVVQRGFQAYRNNQSCLAELCRQIKPKCAQFETGSAPTLGKPGQDLEFCLDRAQTTSQLNKDTLYYYLTEANKRKSRSAIEETMDAISLRSNKYIHGNMLIVNPNATQVRSKLNRQCLIIKPVNKSGSGGSNSEPGFKTFLQAPSSLIIASLVPASNLFRLVLANVFHKVNTLC